jgi:hypothetical protein
VAHATTIAEKKLPVFDASAAYVLKKHGGRVTTQWQLATIQREGFGLIRTTDIESVKGSVGFIASTDCYSVEQRQIQIRSCVPNPGL